MDNSDDDDDGNDDADDDDDDDDGDDVPSSLCLRPPVSGVAKSGHLNLDPGAVLWVNMHGCVKIPRAGTTARRPAGGHKAGLTGAKCGRKRPRRQARNAKAPKSERLRQQFSTPRLPRASGNVNISEHQGSQERSAM